MEIIISAILVEIEMALRITDFNSGAIKSRLML